MKVVQQRTICKHVSVTHPVEFQTAFWLCQCPSTAVHAGVWDVVCLAAVHAMEVGRKRAWALHAAALEGGAAAGAPPAEAARRAAVAAFWEVLADFAATGRPPPAWLDSTTLSHTHPFLARCVPLWQQLCVYAT